MTTPLTQLLEEQKKELDELHRNRTTPPSREEQHTLLTTAITKGYELALEEVEKDMETSQLNPAMNKWFNQGLSAGIKRVSDKIAHLKETK